MTPSTEGDGVAGLVERLTEEAAFTNHVRKPRLHKLLLDAISCIEAAERDRDEALRQTVRYAREAGEATGRLEMSEAAGIVDGWRERALAAEARAERAEKALEEAALVSSAQNPSGQHHDQEGL